MPSAATIRSLIRHNGSRMLHLPYCSQLLSSVEHEAGSRTMFDQLDADKDGSLTEAEIKAGHEAKAGTKSY